jgi:AcrR family transcriptional regulator
MGTRQHTEHGNERKQQLLVAAQELFATRGYAATRVADICDAAGVAKSLFYWYFPTKESLFAALVEDMRYELRRAQGEAMKGSDDPLQQIRLGAEASVRFIADHRSYFALLDVERADPTVSAILQQGGDVYLNDVRRLVHAAQRDGTIVDDDADFLSVGVLAAVSGFTHALRNGRLEVDPEELATSVGRWVSQALSLVGSGRSRG